MEQAEAEVVEEPGMQIRVRLVLDLRSSTAESSTSGQTM